MSIFAKWNSINISYICDGAFICYLLWGNHFFNSNGYSGVCNYCNHCQGDAFFTKGLPLNLQPTWLGWNGAIRVTGYDTEAFVNSIMKDWAVPQGGERGSGGDELCLMPLKVLNCLSRWFLNSVGYCSLLKIISFLLTCSLDAWHPWGLEDSGKESERARETPDHNLGHTAPWG